MRRDQGTHVVGVHVGFVDTDLTAGLQTDKIAPAAVAAEWNSSTVRRSGAVNARCRLSVTGRSSRITENVAQGPRNWRP